jgi:hypothetical protein
MSHLPQIALHLQVLEVQSLSPLLCDHQHRHHVRLQLHHHRDPYLHAPDPLPARCQFDSEHILVSRNISCSCLTVLAYHRLAGSKIAFELIWSQWSAWLLSSSWSMVAAYSSALAIGIVILRKQLHRVSDITETVYAVENRTG